MEERERMAAERGGVLYDGAEDIQTGLRAVGETCAEAVCGRRSM